MPAGWIAGAAVLGGVIGAVGANQAANTQASAAENATNAQLGMFNQVMGNEQPFINAGKGALNPLLFGLGIGPKTGGAPGETYGGLTAPFMTNTFKTMSPAYQFTKQQGTQGVLNADATGGSALAPPALKDLISFNSQNANLSFNNAFNQYQTQQQNIFNRLQTLAGLGMQAGSGGTTGAPSFASSIGQSLTNVGTAQAGGIVGATNAVTGSLGSAMPWLYMNSQTPASAPGGTFYPNSVNNYGDTSVFGGGGGTGGGSVPY